MGWASGSELAEDLYKEIRESIIIEHRKKVANLIVNKFSSMDADAWEEESLLFKDAEIKFDEDI